MNLLLAPGLAAPGDAWAAPGDTWGISGPTFLKVYLTLAVLVVGAAAVHRWRVLADRTPPGARRLTPEQTAYLNGGDDLAVYAAIGELRGAGAIGVDNRHRLVVAGPAPTGVSELGWAVYGAAGSPVPVSALRSDGRVRAALDNLSRGLENAGLALGPEQRRTARLGKTALVVLLLVGAARLVAGLLNGRPVGYLFLVLLGLLVAWLVLRRVPYRTRAGAAALKSLRRQHAHLAPAQSPAYATYGAAGAAMGIALFGTASLWALDPTFAQQAEIQRQALASGGDAGGYSTGSSSGGGCGGGGSSCGGGGGCGGGGCGG